MSGVVYNRPRNPYTLLSGEGSLSLSLTDSKIIQLCISVYLKCTSDSNNIQVLGRRSVWLGSIFGKKDAVWAFALVGLSGGKGGR